MYIYIHTFGFVNMPELLYDRAEYLLLHVIFPFLNFTWIKLFCWAGSSVRKKFRGGGVDCCLMPCGRCGKCHSKRIVDFCDRPRPNHRWCEECREYHILKKGDVWAESTLVKGWDCYLYDDNCNTYKVTEWAECAGLNSRNLKAFGHKDVTCKQKIIVYD